MDDARTIAWIMYALALASKREPANFASISGVADGINHTPPNHHELQNSLKWLVLHGMVQKHHSRYMLAPEGERLMSAVRAKQNTAFGVWAALESALRLCDRSL